MKGRDLLKLRQGLGLTREALAEKTHINLATIRKQERGEWPIPKGMETAYLEVEAAILKDRVRYLVVTTSVPTHEWTKGPWTVYKTNKEASAAVAVYRELGKKEAKIIRVQVRGFQKEHLAREEWRDARMMDV